MKTRPEAILERNVLLDLGQEPDVALYPNESGKGYVGAIFPQLEKALDRPGHRAAWEIVGAILMRNRITYGLGIGSPDRFGSIAGRAAGLEFKASHPPSCACETCTGQRIWHEAFRGRGGHVAMIRSLDEARAFVERIRRGG